MRASLLLSLVSAASTGPCRLTLSRPLCSLSCLIGRGKCRGSMQHVPSMQTPPTEWKMVHLKSDGQSSYWDTVSFPFTSGGEIGRMTDRLPCDGVWLRWTSGTYDYKWHNAPRRQLIASLNGVSTHHAHSSATTHDCTAFSPCALYHHALFMSAHARVRPSLHARVPAHTPQHVEAHVGSGERRRFGPGEVLLADDVKGQGHCTKSLDGAGRWSVFIALPDDSRWGWLWARPTTREAVAVGIAALVACLRYWRSRMAVSRR